MVTASARSRSSAANRSFDHLRREAERGLVEQQQARLRHQAARDREHLLLAAGEQPGALVQPLAQAREALEHRLDLRAVPLAHANKRRGAGCRAPRAPGTPAGPRAPAPRRARTTRCAGSARGLAPSSAMPPLTGRCRPAMRAHQRRLAGAVRAEHRDHLAVVARAGRCPSAPARRRSPRRAGRPRAAARRAPCARGALRARSCASPR